MNVVTLVIGDWSLDGHNQCVTVVLHSNLLSTQIKEAYEKGSELVGFDFSKDCCSDYEDSSIGADKIERLEKVGIDFGDPDNEDYNPLGLEDIRNDDGSQSLTSDSFARIYLAIVRLGNPSFQFEILEGDNINIGGYGLFYS